jgi:hypothetical protein
MEGALSYTEYNLTQTDFIFASANVIGGADLRLGPIVVGGRIGAGSFATTDGNEYGFQHIRGAHITVPLRPGAAIRVSRQQMQVFGSQKELDVYGDGPVMLLPPAANEPTVVTREPKAIETSILLITSPEYIGSTKWQFSAATGTTSPGGPIGSSRMLRASAFSQISAFRDIPWYGLEGRVTWTTSAHESVLPTVFLGYDGNFRSKTIDGFGLGVSRTTGRLFEHFSVRYGSGVEVADWRDEHQLLTRDGKELRAGIEAGIGVDVGVRWHFGRNLAFETSFEKVYWPAIDLGEFRTGFGLVITR